MLAQLAVVKDVVSWVMVPLSAVLIECARRQWARARIANGCAGSLEGGLREYDWKSGVSVAVNNGPPSYEMANRPGRSASMAKPLPVNPGVVEIGLPPSRKGTFDRMEYGNGNGSGMHGVPVRAGYGVGASYETRF